MIVNKSHTSVIKTRRIKIIQYYIIEIIEGQHSSLITSDEHEAAFTQTDVKKIVEKAKTPDCGKSTVN